LRDPRSLLPLLHVLGNFFRTTFLSKKRRGEQELNSMTYMKEAKLWYKATKRPSLRTIRKEIDEAYIDSTLTDEENIELLKPTLKDMVGQL